MLYLDPVNSITYLYVKIMKRTKEKKSFPLLKKKTHSAEWLHIHFSKS